MPVASEPRLLCTSLYYYETLADAFNSMQKGKASPLT